MAIAWSDFTYLTQAQRGKLEEFRVIGVALGDSQTPNVSNVTDNQAKQAANFLNSDLGQLVTPTERGVRYVREQYRNATLKNYEDSVIPGP